MKLSESMKNYMKIISEGKNNLNAYGVLKSYLSDVMKLENKIEQLKKYKNEFIKKLESGFLELLWLTVYNADFSNGVNYNGIDEGITKSYKIIDDICKKTFNKNYNEILKLRQNNE
jgi:hypothetical protein